MKTEDLNTITAMTRHGGRFASAFANAFSRADHVNFKKLKNAFPEMWEKYTDLGEKARDQDFT